MPRKWFPLGEDAHYSPSLLRHFQQTFKPMTFHSSILHHPSSHLASEDVKGEVKAKIKISPVVVFGVLSRMVVVRGS